MSKCWLKNCLKFDIKNKSAIVIIMDISKKVIKLYFEKLRFEKTVKIVKKYWETGPD